MNDELKISNAVIKRLPRYRRYLNELRRKGVSKISSREFSELIGYTASQIRQDFNNFGGFGQQGYGYNVDDLYSEISNILGLDREYKMVIVGAGNLGQAIANHNYYHRSGFVVDSLFDVNPKIIGLKINDINVRDYEQMSEYIGNHKVDIGIICTTKEVAQEVADKMVKGGIRGIWNFAPVDLCVPQWVSVENVQLSEGLHSLAYYINQNADSLEENEK